VASPVACHPSQQITNKIKKTGALGHRIYEPFSKNPYEGKDKINKSLPSRRAPKQGSFYAPHPSLFRKNL